MTPLDEALANLLAALRPVTRRLIRIVDAPGRVLADPIRSPAPVPAEAVALRDGWAVAAHDVVGASSYTPVPLLRPPVWIGTGQGMPAGTDAVLPPDAVIADATLPQVVGSVAPGDGVRRIGEDAAPGVILKAAGERMRPGDVAVALAAGVESAAVHEARLRLIALTGPALGAGSVELVGAYADAAGAVVESVRAPSRGEGSVLPLLEAPGADLIVVLGAAVSLDEGAAAALARKGSVLAHAIAMRPAETTACGMVGAAPVIFAPGRVEGALAATLLLVLPCLDRLMGAVPRSRSISGRLTRKVSSSVGMTELVLLRAGAEGLEPLAAGDLTLTALAAADAWLAVPADQEGFGAGETVTAFLL